MVRTYTCDTSAVYTPQSAVHARRSAVRARRQTIDVNKSVGDRRRRGLAAVLLDTESKRVRPRRRLGDTKHPDVNDRIRHLYTIDIRYIYRYLYVCMHVYIYIYIHVHI